jgi:hypothetical protein
MMIPSLLVAIAIKGLLLCSRIPFVFHSHPHTNPLLLTTNHQTISIMSGYNNNNDAYGTSGTTGGLGVCLILNLSIHSIEVADSQ